MCITHIYSLPHFTAIKWTQCKLTHCIFFEWWCLPVNDCCQQITSSSLHILSCYLPACLPVILSTSNSAKRWMAAVFDILILNVFGPIAVCICERFWTYLFNMRLIWLLAVQLRDRERDRPSSPLACQPVSLDIGHYKCNNMYICIDVSAGN